MFRYLPNIIWVFAQKVNKNILNFEHYLAVFKCVQKIVLNRMWQEWCPEVGSTTYTRIFSAWLEV